MTNDAEHASDAVDPLPRTDLDADNLLVNLVAVANLVDAEDDYHYDVVLTIGGTIVSGEMVSGAQYAAWAAKGSDFFAPLIDFYGARVGVPITQDVLDSTSYIHLANATIYSGSDRLNVGYWRGLLDRVDGWSIGTLVGPK